MSRIPFALATLLGVTVMSAVAIRDACTVKFLPYSFCGELPGPLNMLLTAMLIGIVSMVLVIVWPSRR